MILSKETMDIFHSFLSINEGIVVKPGKTLRIFSEAGDTFVRANVAEEFDQEFAIYDLFQFISIVNKLFKTPPTLDFKEKWVNISGKDSSCKYFYSDPSTIKYFNKDIEIKPEDVVLEFDISNEQLNELRSAAGVVGLDVVKLSNTNGKLVATLSLKEASKDNKFSLVIGDTDCTENFDLYLRSENLSLFKGDYKVRIARHDQILIFNAKNQNTDIEYFISMGSDSKYEI